jgi:hypothetical protein
MRVHADPEYLLNLDFQSGHDSAVLPRRLRMYNGVLDFRHDRLVVSAAVVLRPEADSPQLTGFAERGFPGQECSVENLFLAVGNSALEPRRGGIG